MQGSQASSTGLVPPPPLSLLSWQFFATSEEQGWGGRGQWHQKWQQCRVLAERGGREWRGILPPLCFWEAVQCRMVGGGASSPPMPPLSILMGNSLVYILHCCPGDLSFKNTVVFSRWQWWLIMQNTRLQEARKLASLSIAINLPLPELETACLQSWWKLCQKVKTVIGRLEVLIWGKVRLFSTSNHYTFTWDFCISNNHNVFDLSSAFS